MYDTDDKKPVILFDADDVAVDFLRMLLFEINRQYGTDVQPEHVHSWNLMAHFPNLTHKQVFGVLDNEDIWKHLYPMPESQIYLSKLHDEGYVLYLTTATSIANCKKKCARLRELFPFLDEEHIIIAHNKQMIKGNVLIDDGPHNLVGGEYYKILFERPHNAKFPNDEYDMHRVKTWSDVYRLIHDNFPIEKNGGNNDK